MAYRSGSTGRRGVGGGGGGVRIVEFGCGRPSIHHPTRCFFMSIGGWEGRGVPTSDWTSDAVVRCIARVRL